MKKDRISISIVVSASLMMGAPPTPADAETKDDCRENDRVIYEPAGEHASGRIHLDQKRPEDKELLEISKLESTQSPRGTKSCRIRAPDFSGDGPWNTSVYISGNKAKPIWLKISFREHGNGGVRTRWTNEKLFLLRAWRGRIVATDIILNVQTEEFVYIEDANYANIVMSCAEKQLMQEK